MRISSAQFKRLIWAHYRQHPRPMPWRRTRDPYRILVSEIMLQQTQVSRVVPFYKNFIKKFPNIRALAKARTAELLAVWQGLGYNRRALALQRLAREVIERYKGKLPRGKDELIQLAGIGPYTAGAIRAFAFNEPEIFIETNIRRVFIHFFFAGRTNVTDTAIRRYIERTLDSGNPREWYWALMDYGAMLGGAAPRENPNRRSAHYARQSKFDGSDRKIRGKILHELLVKKKASFASIVASYKEPRARISKIVAGLARDGFISQRGGYIHITK